MPQRFSLRIKFLVERFMVRGAHYQLLVVAAVIGLISVAGGALVLGDAEFGTLGEATWWAFLRLTDPGYLGDDTGTFRRTVSTALTVLGYVVFLGALVAIMTEWLQATMRRLESGLTPVVRDGHVVLLGWTGRTAAIVHSMLGSAGAVRRFLQQQGIRRFHLVVLAENANARLTQELQDRLGGLWDSRQITLRSGSPLRADQLGRADVLHASAILIQAADLAEDEPDLADARTIKTLLSLSTGSSPRRKQPGGLPLVVAEVFDVRKVPVAQRAYAGPIEVLAIDALVSRFIAQIVRQRGLSHVYNALTQKRGNEIHIREVPRLSGRRLHELSSHFPEAVVLGAVRPAGRSFESLLNPLEPVTLAPGDRLVLLVRSDDAREPEALPVAAVADVPRRAAPRPSDPPPTRRVLVMGWSHMVPALVAEFASYERERFELRVVSTIPAVRRDRQLSRYQIDLDRVRVEHIEADYTVLPELARVEPASHDNIVLVGSDGLRSGADADARTIVGYLLLQELLADGQRPDILVELLDAESMPLLGQPAGEVLITPEILSHMLAQVALCPELRAVFDELFTASGAKVAFRACARYGLSEGDHAFQRLREGALARGETALGVFLASRGLGAEQLHLNPRPASRWRLTAQDELVVLTRDGDW